MLETEVDTTMPCFSGAFTQYHTKSLNFIKIISSLFTHSASVCDFEGGSCGWYELTFGDGFDWVRGSSVEVPPDHHPPPLDHSTNSTEGKETNIYSVAMRPSTKRSHWNKYDELMSLCPGCVVRNNWQNYLQIK